MTSTHAAAWLALAERLADYASVQRCFGDFDGACIEHTDNPADWCGLCAAGRAAATLRAMAAQPQATASADDLVDAIFKCWSDAPVWISDAAHAEMVAAILARDRAMTDHGHSTHAAAWLALAEEHERDASTLMAVGREPFLTIAATLRRAATSLRAMAAGRQEAAKPALALAERLGEIVDSRPPEAIQILGFPMPLARELLAALRAMAAQQEQVLHLATYGEQGADDVPTACGIRCSTWDKPVRYVWERSQATCRECLAAKPAAGQQEKG